MKLLLTSMALLFCFAGCMQAKERREDLGPEVPSRKIGDAIDRASMKADLSGIATGQYILMNHTRRIENTETVINLGILQVDVMNRVDSADEFTVSLRISELLRQNDGKFQSKISEDELRIGKPKTAAEALMRDIQATHVSFKKRNGVSATAAQPRKTFHHFRESDQLIDPPDLVKRRAGCGGLPNCKLRVHYVQFDLVIWEDDDKNYQKVSFDFAFSLQTPYLPFGEEMQLLNGVLITDCRSTYVPIESRTVYVRDCSTLADFKK